MKNGTMRHEGSGNVVEIIRPQRAPFRILPDAGMQHSNVIHNTGTLIVMYGNPKTPPVNTDWWLLAECLMLATYALAATVWMILSR